LAPAYPEARFVLAGADTQPDNTALAAAIAGHGLAGRVLSLGERSDLEELYPAFDIVSLASAFGEALPMVLGEAMACGVPCVATDTGDCAAVIADAGIIVPPRDPQALAAGWQRMIALGRDGRRALGLRARAQIVENYNLERIVPRFEALYCEITAQDPARRS
jgi:glycosyltransferase involved in cell wall biosynthesis